MVTTLTITDKPSDNPTTAITTIAALNNNQIEMCQSSLLCIDALARYLVNDNSTNHNSGSNNNNNSGSNNSSNSNNSNIMKDEWMTNVMETFKDIIQLSSLIITYINTTATNSQTTISHSQTSNSQTDSNEVSIMNSHKKKRIETKTNNNNNHLNVIATNIITINNNNNNNINNNHNLIGLLKLLGSIFLSCGTLTSAVGPRALALLPVSHSLTALNFTH